MIKGCDVSHWNSIVNYPDFKFCIIKATEGTHFVDKKKNDHTKNALSFGCEVGFYHYARPEKNSPEAEAEFFLKNIDKDLIGRCLLALDWENVALNYPIIWARDWLDFVYKKTGVKPLFYYERYR